MGRPNHASEKQAEKKHSPEVAKPQVQPSPLEVAGIDPAMLYSGGTVEAQASTLNRLHAVQRQAAVEHINQTQGNTHVQTLVKTLAASPATTTESPAPEKTVSRAVEDKKTAPMELLQEKQGLPPLPETLVKPTSPPAANPQPTPTVQSKPQSAPAVQAKPQSISAAKPSQPTVQAKVQPAVVKNVPAVQPKLSVSQPGDPYEVEADRVADEVMRMPGRATPPEDPDKTPGDTISRLQRKGVNAPQTTPQIETKIQQMRGGGRPLPDSERDFFEPRMGVDLSNVRVHSDGDAVQLSRDLQARAFTVGSDVAFNSGEYQPGTPEGRRLMAHELTHVVQQGGAGSLKRKKVSRKVDPEVQRAAQPEPVTGVNVRPEIEIVKPQKSGAAGLSQPTPQDIFSGTKPGGIKATGKLKGLNLPTPQDPAVTTGDPTAQMGAFSGKAPANKENEAQPGRLPAGTMPESTAEAKTPADPGMKNPGLAAEKSPLEAKAGPQAGVPGTEAEAKAAADPESKKPEEKAAAPQVAQPAEKKPETAPTATPPDKAGAETEKGAVDKAGAAKAEVEAKVKLEPGDGKMAPETKKLEGTLQAVQDETFTSTKEQSAATEATIAEQKEKTAQSDEALAKIEQETQQTAVTLTTSLSEMKKIVTDREIRFAPPPPEAFAFSPMNRGAMNAGAFGGQPAGAETAEAEPQTEAAGTTPDQQAETAQPQQPAEDGPSGEKEGDGPADKILQEFISRNLGRASQISALAQSASSKINPASTAAQGAVQTSITKNLTTIKTSIDKARATAQTDADTAINTIETGFQTSLTNLQTATDDAKKKVEDDYTTKNTDLDTAETDALKAVDDRFLTAQNDIAAATTAAIGDLDKLCQDAITAVTAQYQGKKADPILEGASYYQDKIKAATDAANQVKEAYKQEFQKQGDDVAAQLPDGKPDVVTTVQEQIQTARTQLTTERDAAVKAIDDSHTSSVTAVTDAHDAQLKIVNDGLTATLTSLQDLETSLNTQVNTQGAQKKSAIAAEAQQQISSVQSTGARLAEELTNAVNECAEKARNIPSPDPKKLKKILDAEQQKLDGLAGQLQGQLEQQIDAAGQSVHAKATAGSLALDQIGQGVTASVDPISTGFTETTTTASTTATTTYTDTETAHKTLADDRAQQAIDKFTTDYETCTTNLEAVSTALDEQLTAFVNDTFKKGLDDAKPQFSTQCQAEAQKAADQVQPLWATVVKILIAIVVAVVVMVLVAVTGGVAGFFLGLFLAAVVGAIGGVASNGIDNIVAGKDFFENAGQAALIGAIDGALQFVGGKLTAGLTKGMTNALGKTLVGIGVDTVIDTTNACIGSAIKGEFKPENIIGEFAKALLMNVATAGLQAGFEKAGKFLGKFDIPGKIGNLPFVKKAGDMFNGMKNKLVTKMGDMFNGIKSKLATKMGDLFDKVKSNPIVTKMLDFKNSAAKFLNPSQMTKDDFLKVFGGNGKTTIPLRNHHQRIYDNVTGNKAQMIGTNPIKYNNHFRNLVGRDLRVKGQGYIPEWHAFNGIDPKAKAYLEQNGIKVVDYQDIARKVNGVIDTVKDVAGKGKWLLDKVNDAVWKKDVTGDDIKKVIGEEIEKNGIKETVKAQYPNIAGDVNSAVWGNPYQKDADNNVKETPEFKFDSPLANQPVPATGGQP